MDTTSSLNHVREFWFESAATRLFCVECGAGRPIIMLHGGLADHSVSLAMVAPLATRYRIITPDLRASGKSWCPGPLTWDGLARDVAALMDHLEIPRALVGGGSGGSGVALRFALRHPERLAGLVLVKPVYAGSERGFSPVQAAAFEMMNAAGRRAPAEGVQVLRPLFARLPPEVKEQALAMLAGFDARSVAATTAFLASGAQPFDSVSELQGLRVPTLVIPEGDALHPAEVASLCCSNIPSCHACPSLTGASKAIEDFCEQHAVWRTEGAPVLSQP